jgi:uncharacterized protein (DUF2126 family)
MLPYFVWLDFEDRRDAPRRREIRSDWFLPHFEFRFPLAGRRRCARRT